MEQKYFENQKFSNPEEEISFLKEYIANKEKEVEQQKSIETGQLEDSEKIEIISESINQYNDHTPEEVLDKGHIVPEKFRDEIVLKLSPEGHDAKMSELVSLVYEKGISNTLDVIKRMENQHIYDDFHRFLIQYLKEGYPVTGLQEGTPLYKVLKRTLFEVSITNSDKEDAKTLEELIFAMEQFFAGMISVSDVDKNDYLTLEIANSIDNQEFIFYISVPDNKKDLFEKQILSVFPTAILIEQKNDFNIFNENGFSDGNYASLKNLPANPIKTADEFKNDPLRVILNVFSKLDKTTEGAAIQLIFKPTGGFYEKNYSKALKKVEKGEEAEELHYLNTKSDRIISGFSKFIKSVDKTVNSFSAKEEKDDDFKNKSSDNRLAENIVHKLKSSIVSTNIRIVASASSQSRATDILNDLRSAFNQFTNPLGNEFEFKELKPKDKKIFFDEFTYRQFDIKFDAPLNLSELATIFHFTDQSSDLSPQLRSNKSKTAPAPLSIKNEGIKLGDNVNRGIMTPIHFSADDRLRHFYTIGQTGTGKTNFMKTMIIQDIQNGEGVCMIDPHGSDIQDVLANIPPERYEDLIYFDPANMQRPMALNMLEYDPNFPEQKTFVVNEMFSIFTKLYKGSPESMGPMFEQYFRNSTQLVIEDPETGCTLLDVSRVMADEKFRKLKLSRCKNPIVKQFWEEIAGKAGGEASLQNIVPYITSKFDIFLANDIMRPVVAQEKSSFNFRKIMDEKKILLVNLSKGRLGDINSNLIGLILVGKILMAALSRADSMGKNFPTFYLYIDEFQNITTDSISTILSEARKYKLSLNIAHQYIAQLDEKIKDSVFGNVGSMAVFRVGGDDAKYLESQFNPVFDAADIMNIDNYNCYLKMLVSGVPVTPFNLKTMRSPEGNFKVLDQLKELSSLKYGRSKELVESEIMKKYEKKPPTISEDISNY